MPWRRYREEGLKERCAGRAAELGKTLAQLLIEAKMGHDTLDRIPPQGRRTDTLDKLAEALDWPIAKVMGVAFDVRFDGGTIKRMHALTCRVLRQPLPSLPDEYYEELAALQNLLIARMADGQPVTNDYLDGIEATLLASTPTATTSDGILTGFKRLLRKPRNA